MICNKKIGQKEVGQAACLKPLFSNSPSFMDLKTKGKCLFFVIPGFDPLEDR